MINQLEFKKKIKAHPIINYAESRSQSHCKSNGTRSCRAVKCSSKLNIVHASPIMRIRPASAWLGSRDFLN